MVITLCEDYRRSTMQAEPNHYPGSNIADVTTYLSLEKVFSTLNLLKGYYLVLINTDDISKTAINTPFGICTFIYFHYRFRSALHATSDYTSAHLWRFMLSSLSRTWKCSMQNLVKRLRFLPSTVSITISRRQGPQFLLY
ncbi:uncharacterized protein [Palaemon carinicauda]|uniref:uncharacterized protein n=1 Tax=Palaemon carinicauda TaxID=392227 RepID=UPI0035B5D3FB